MCLYDGAKHFDCYVVFVRTIVVVLVAITHCSLCYKYIHISDIVVCRCCRRCRFTNNILFYH